MHLPKPSEGSDFAPPPAGTFPAICYRFIDLGTQQTTFKGDQKEQHKILLSWELKDDECMMEVEGEMMPMTIHQRFTWSMHEKATLRKMLESWRGLKFQEKDFGPGGFDVRNLLSKACMLAIVHSEKEGKAYANVASVLKLPKGMQAGQLVNPTAFLALERGLFDQKVFDGLSDGLQATIKKSPEYHELFRPGAGAETRAAVGGGNGFDDEIPFAPCT
jgi:hypothetical protein